MKHLILPAFCALALAAPAAAQPAAPAQASRSIAVSAAGLDLSRSNDAAVMTARLEDAALNACGGSRFSYRQVNDAVRSSSCYRDAMAQALSNLHGLAASGSVAAGR